MLRDARVIMPGLVARLNNNGFTACELRMEAAPEIFTDAVIKSEMAALPGWRFRKEYLLDFDAQSGKPVFEPAWLDVQRARLCDPIYRMDLDESGKLVKRDGGRLAVWIPPDFRPKEVPSTIKSARLGFAAGLDVAEGVLASDSTIEVFRAANREQAAELADNAIAPTDLGRFAVAVGRYYNNALLCPVRKLHGLTTLRAILDECAYPYVWHDKIADRIFPSQTDRMGWRGGEASSEFLFGPWTDAIQHDKTILHSANCLKQHQQYIFDEMGRITHQALAQMPVQVRERHGDRVVGCALAYRACLDMPAFVRMVEKEVPYMSFQWRHEQAVKAQKKEGVVW